MKIKSKTIEVRLSGGLGNQVFQLGAALLLSSKTNYKTIVLDDYALSSYKVSRKFDLPRFFNLSHNRVQIILKRRFLNTLRLPRLFSFKFSLAPFVGDNNFQFIVDTNIVRSRLLDGYFQNLRQSDFESIVLLLTPMLSDKFIKLEQLESKVCVVHVRGGDFLDLGRNELTPVKYYIDAMTVMRNKYGVNAFVVVTDDEGYAKKVLSHKGFNIKIISNNIDEDFFTLASYSKRILSASTFALWASALGRNQEDGVIIAPDELTPGVKRSFILPNEIKIFTK